MGTPSLGGVTGSQGYSWSWELPDPGAALLHGSRSLTSACTDPNKTSLEIAFPIMPSVPRSSNHQTYFLGTQTLGKDVFKMGWWSSIWPHLANPSYHTLAAWRCRYALLFSIKLNYMPEAQNLLRQTQWLRAGLSIRVTWVRVLALPLSIYNFWSIIWLFSASCKIIQNNVKSSTYFLSSGLNETYVKHIAQKLEWNEPQDNHKLIQCFGDARYSAWRAEPPWHSVSSSTWLTTSQSIQLGTLSLATTPVPPATLQTSVVSLKISFCWAILISFFFWQGY